MILLAVAFAVASVATSAHLPASTNNAGAQAALDRGLFLYYAYDGSGAAKEFREAAALDPRLAMALWGIALADGPDLNTPMTAARFDDAAQAIRRATALASTQTPREQRFVAIMAMRYRGTYADWASDDAAYRQAMLAFAQSTNDQNARLLAAEALLEAGGLTWRNGKLADSQSQQALGLVTAVLHDDPSSVMANHLCIHLYDLAPDRTPALPCAQRLDAATFPPQAEHLAHMPAHYWIEVGDYAAAVNASERAYTLLTRLGGGMDSEQGQHYAKHDVAVGYSAAMMLGNYDVAQRWGGRMSGLFGAAFDALTALRFGRYAEAYAAQGNQFAGASVRGLAALRMGRNAEARTLAAQLPAETFARAYIPQIFLARLAQSSGKYDEAEQWIERSRANQSSAFGGELIPLLPADEALGDMRLERGDAIGAIAAFTRALDLYPNDPRALFGLAEALTAVRDGARAQSARARFDKEWKGADTNVRDALL